MHRVFVFVFLFIPPDIYAFRYTLLVGKPPFETTSLKDTYQKIKRNEYHIPSKISLEARMLITKLLRPNPATRPSATEILSDPFFSCGYHPERLPVRLVTDNKGTTNNF